MSRRWVPTAPLPDKYRLSVLVVKDEHPELHALLSSLPQGGIAPWTRAALLRAIHAEQQGGSPPAEVGRPAAAAGEAEHLSRSASAESISAAAALMPRTSPPTPAVPSPTFAHQEPPSITSSVDRNDDGGDLLRDVGSAFR